ncbi:hypothetical protein V5799_009196 [Amblyomma americanum]|uniref:Uncharacterized protein n=1 Tax=Amblyomma americanum TaxID=6943 RepID=A0AAQ4FB61_AMBAM
MYTYNPSFSLPFAEKERKYRSRDLSEPTLTVLQSREKIVLVLISKAAWRISRCHCMESTFEEALHNYAVRSVTCHVPLDEESTALSSQKETQKINFTVEHKNAATKVYLKGESSDLPFALQGSYLVLAATTTCIVVQISDLVRGEPLCALWGLENARGNDEQYCFDMMQQICMQPVFDTFIERERCGTRYAEENE